MQFNEKLDILMKTLQVSNRRLARALSIDPSLVSRWRTGARRPSEKADYVKDISEFISTYTTRDYQKAAVYEVMGMEIDRSQMHLYPLADHLHIWLAKGKTSNEVFVEKFFNNLNKKENDKLTVDDVPEEIKVEAGKEDLEILQGTAGKRKGVIKFLQAVAASESKTTLLLYSNEDMEWLTGDKEFHHKWGRLLRKVIANGHKIKIIHTIKRDMSEMLAAIDYWMPLYLSGAIEPYYYPKYQENIFRRTIFVAPGISALTCSTVSEYADKAHQILYWDAQKIKDLTAEYNSLLERCRLLMRIYTGENTYNFNQLQIEFAEQPGEMISIASVPSFFTLPESLLKELLNKNAVEENIREAVLSMHEQRLKFFESNILDHQYYEIIKLPDIDAATEEVTSPGIVDIYGEFDLNYNAVNLQQHLSHNLQLLKEYKNYHLYLINNFPYDNIRLAVKDEVGAVINRNGENPIIFAFNQTDMTNSFYRYLKNTIKRIQDKEKDKEQVISRLERYIDDLSS
ncbi:MAG: hypothetical protein ACQEQG_10350 [Bacillota bacterium]